MSTFWAAPCNCKIEFDNDTLLVKSWPVRCNLHKRAGFSGKLLTKLKVKKRTDDIKAVRRYHDDFVRGLKRDTK